MRLLSRFHGRAELPPSDDWLDRPTFLRRRDLDEGEWERPSHVGEVHYAPRRPVRATMRPPSGPGFWMARVPGTHPWTVYEVLADADGVLWFGWGDEPAQRVTGSGLEWGSRPTQEVPT